jgi:hypothetical protein
MNCRDRVDIIRRFYLGRDAVRLVSSRRAWFMQQFDRTIEEGLQTLLIGRGMLLINAYYEAGETDEAFETLHRTARELAAAAAQLERDREAIVDLILGQIRTQVEPMYDAGTTERLMVAFECGFRPRHGID